MKLVDQFRNTHPVCQLISPSGAECYAPLELHNTLKTIGRYQYIAPLGLLDHPIPDLRLELSRMGVIYSKLNPLVLRELRNVQL